MAPKLYGYPDNFRVKKVLISAKLAKKDLKVIPQLPPSDRFPLEQAPALEDGNKVLISAKLAKKDLKVIPQLPPSDRFPLEQAPALEDGNVCLFGAEAICKYLLGNNSVYLPQNPEMDQWIGWAECNLLPNVLSYVLPSVSAAKIDPNTLELAKKELLAQLSIFNQILLHKTFLVGIPTLIGEFVFIGQPSTFNEHDKIVGVGKPAKKEKESKQEKPKSAEKEKQPKKKAKEEAEEEMDAAEQAIADQPKFTDPLAALPPATKAIPYFWENFDPVHYSIWFSEYKYPEELKFTYMSCNLIGGMFQRLEKLKKNAFASVCLFGTDNNSTISGVWVWRGHELAFDLSQDWQVDYESYSWKKLDPNDENNKKMVNEYFMWEGDFGGKKFNQGKIFK
uniref:Elongation factor 1-gamma n=1 Tax=Globodera pallida TaxID=36090 RepID=A0A183BUR0_GLOPA